MLFKKKGGRPTLTHAQMMKTLDKLNLKPIKEPHNTEKYVRYRILEPDYDKYEYRIKHTGKTSKYDLIMQIDKGSAPYFEKGPYPKKYTVHYNGKAIHFGDVRYQHYKDKALGLYSHLDHLDKARMQDYRDRHSKIMLKDGTPAYKSKSSPAYYSWHYLWSE